MKFRSLVFCACLFLPASSVFGDDPLATMSIGTHYMLNTNVERTFPIYISSSLYTEGLDLAVQIDDGGPMNGGGISTAPTITNLDAIGPGTIFHASNLGSIITFLNPEDPSLPPGMCALNSTMTEEGVLLANGVFAYITVNPLGAEIGSTHNIYLSDVEAYASGPYNTDIALTDPVEAYNPQYSNDGIIKIVALHNSVWNAGGDGNWTDASWTNPEPPFPNYTANAVVDTAHAVSANGVQEANSLSVSNGGQVLVSAGGTLTLTEGLNLGTGSIVRIDGDFHAQDASVNGTLIVAGTAELNSIDGSGTIEVGGSSGNAVLTVGSLRVSTLILGNSSLATVPEPSTFMLLGAAIFGLIAYAWRRHAA